MQIAHAIKLYQEAGEAAKQAITETVQRHGRRIKDGYLLMLNESASVVYMDRLVYVESVHLNHEDELKVFCRDYEYMAEGELKPLHVGNLDLDELIEVGQIAEQSHE